MSATMARQGGQVQLEQSDMRRALNVAKMAKEGVLHATIEEMQYLMKQPVSESPKREEVGSWGSWLWRCEGCDEKTPGYGSWKSNGRLHSLPNGTA